LLFFYFSSRICRRVPAKYEALFETISGDLISSAKTRK
jgi:hypothetical protein